MKKFKPEYVQRAPGSKKHILPPHSQAVSNRTSVEIWAVHCRPRKRITCSITHRAKLVSIFISELYTLVIHTKTCVDKYHPYVSSQINMFSLIVWPTQEVMHVFSLSNINPKSPLSHCKSTENTAIPREKSGMGSLLGFSQPATSQTLTKSPIILNFDGMKKGLLPLRHLN